MSQTEQYMTAAQLNLEAELDAQSAEERWEESFQNQPEPDEWCMTCSEEHDEDEPCEQDEPDGMEDQWLDGSYEE